MGNRLSGTLAILCLDRFERLYIYRELHPKPVVYVRYVDDVGTTVNGTDEAEVMLKYLNSKHKTIQFETELPDEAGVLPILDLKIKINEWGNIERKLYVKTASKGITLHFNSHHPTSTKRAVVGNELRRAKQAATEEHRAEAIAVTETKLRNNGFPNDWLKPRRAPAPQRKEPAE